MTLEEPKSKEKISIEVSRQKPEDVEGITNVYYQSWLSTYPNKEAGVTREDVEYKFQDAFSEEGLAKRRNYIENRKDNELFLMAKENGKVVGVCGVVREEGANKLRTIYVLPEYQGKGVGSRLWEEARKFLDAGQDTFVEVVDYNQNAIDFYKRKGFVDTGKRHQDEKFRMKSGAIFTEMEMMRKAEQESE